MKETLTVKREGKPVRCEVCHQTDRFDPQTGVCGRCSSAFGGVPGREKPSVFLRWDIPEPFWGPLIQAAGQEGIWWVGRPAKRFARQTSVFGYLFLFLLVFFLFLALAWESFAFLAVAVVFAIFMFLNFGNAGGDNRRIDATLYVVTESRALVIRADTPDDWREYAPQRNVLRCEMFEEQANVGHVIFAEEPYHPQRGEMNAWDKSLNGLFGKTINRGFFFIENPREVERIVREKILGEGSER